MVTADTIKCSASVPADRVTFATSQAHGGGQDGTLLYGEILDADVVTVETILSDGQVIQDNNADNIFVLFDPEGRTAQELRVLDQAGGVLGTHEITNMRACY